MKTGVRNQLAFIYSNANVQNLEKHEEEEEEPVEAEEEKTSIKQSWDQIKANL